MIEQVVERWHQFLRSGRPELLDALLDDAVVFFSPIVHTPQRGKAITALYLRAAAQTLPGGAALGTARGSGVVPPVAGGFRYTKQVLSGDHAVLEFETSIGGTYVNGVDIITANDEGRIVEFRVMVRPLQAVNLVHERMAATLERLGSEA